jgi:hypothetical protein
MPRHPPNALTSRLKTRTTNDNTVSFNTRLPLIARHQTISSVSTALALTGRSITRATNAISTASFKKTHSQCQRLTIGQTPKARDHRRNMCDGKLVAYILEENGYSLACLRMRKEWWSLSGSNR